MVAIVRHSRKDTNSNYRQLETCDGVMRGWCFGWLVFYNIVFEISHTVPITTLRDRTAELWAGAWGSTPAASASIGKV